MNFLSLNQLNLKILDFTNLMTPLGVVKKIVSNGETHLFEILFHSKILLMDGQFKVDKNTNIIENTHFKLFCDKELGFIINENCCIIEIPNMIEVDKNEDLKTITKNLRKNITKKCSQILQSGFNLKKKKITDPESINIINFEGFHVVDL